MEEKGVSIFSIFSFSILLLVLMPNMELVSATVTTTKSSSTTTYYKYYVKTACNSTMYPKECYKSLSSCASTIQANPDKLCTAAITVTLKAARNASAVIAYLSKLQGLSPSDAAVIKECAENVNDSLDELKDSLKAMENSRGSDRKFQLANVKTWASAALTDDSTCTDDVDDKKVSNMVKNTMNKSIKYLARLTSNLLALMNSLDY
ncbi:hypothetical protein SLA2020_144440 [Shorea laevis]